MFFIYAIPILPIVLVIIALLCAGASWIKDVLPILSGLVIFKNIYIDLYYSICKKSHNPAVAVCQFLFGIARVAVFFPIINKFLTSSGGLLGVIDLILSLVLVVPIISILWLMGEFAALSYGLSQQSESARFSIFSNIFSIICVLLIYLFFFH